MRHSVCDLADAVRESSLDGEIMMEQHRQDGIDGQAIGKDAAKAVLTITEVAQVLRCSKTHVSNLLHGRVCGLPPLTHLALGRRKLVRREWLELWLEAIRIRC